MTDAILTLATDDVLPMVALAPQLAPEYGLTERATLDLLAAGYVNGRIRGRLIATQHALRKLSANPAAPRTLCRRDRTRRSQAGIRRSDRDG